LHIHIALGKRGIENMNGLVRQYIPKRTNFRGISRGAGKLYRNSTTDPERKWIFKASRQVV